MRSPLQQPPRERLLRAYKWALQNPGTLFALVWSGIVWSVAHPLTLLKLATSMHRRDGQALARHLDELTARDAALHLMVVGGVQEVTFARQELLWRTDLGDDIGASLWRDGTYEGEEIAALLNWLSAADRANDYVVDVGANIGTTTIPFAQAGYRVLAIEPMPHNFDMLATNVARNGYESHVTLANCAIGTTVGQIQMWTGFGSGQAEVAVDDKLPSSTRFGADAGSLETVRSMPLGDLIKDESISLGDIALVWSDVQGSETSVIESAAELWRAGVPLYLEVDPTSLAIHGGVPSFVGAVEASFSTFLTREDLLDQRGARSCDTFAAWVETISANSYSDALLIP